MLNQNDPLKDQNNQSDSKTPLKNKSSLLDETKKKFQTKAWFIDASLQHRSHDFIISIPSDLLKEFLDMNLDMKMRSLNTLFR